MYKEDNLIEVTELSWLQKQIPGAKLVQFYNLVNTHNPLDLKSNVVTLENGETLNWSIWGRGYSPDYYASDGSLRSDYLGNYLFGYYGKGSGAVKEISDIMFPNNIPVLKIDDQLKELSEGEILKYGAGVAQFFSNGEFNVDAMKGYLKNISEGNYGNNPGDASMIQEGITDYEKSH